ncbi:beta strand repeat-containing protein [Clostridium beijerinckii]|uniref:beta strand repeat-containing protein n=1 Tax=Clostridium beijerinckii TaxID=1520 RepID=UPI00047A994D|nr:hypothetical protein [Clostridium beijerinckii]
MYNVSDSYKTFIKKPSRSFECRITLGNRAFNNSDIIQIVPTVVQPSDRFSIGNTVSQSIDITLKNDGEAYASVGEIDVEIGLKINNSIEYIPFGTFNIDDVSKTDYTVKLTCYDNMVKFETGYFSKLGNNPTLQEVVNELASITGVEFTGTVQNYIVTKLEGYTCREVLAYVASVCGGNAYITRDNKFTIIYPHEVDCTITADNYFSTGYKLEDQTYKIGMITCQNKSNSNNDSSESDDYDSVNDKNTISVGSLSSDTMELTFENPWVTESILNDIYNKLKNFSYLGYTLKWQGDLSLDPLDIITLVDKNNVTRKALVFANKLTYNGGLSAETSAKGETKNSNSFSASGSANKNIERLSVKLLIAEKAIINKASIADLQANSARIDKLDANVATINTALIDYANISNATIADLVATKATVSDLTASVANIDSALINKANVGDLTTTNATVANLNSDLANVKTLINGNLTSANIQSLVLTSSKVTVDNGFIKNAMIESLDATKINTGSLNTSKISVTSSDGSLLIAGATQQFKDKNGKVRIQMGQDAQGNFNFILVAGDGTTTLIDGTGVKANAIADKLIKTNMVADSAIGEQQINYSSFVTGFNKATNTSYINASKVAIDLTGQTLDVSFNNINTKVDGVKTTTDTNTTSISAIQGQISTLISNTTITTNGTTTQLKDAYNSTVNTINSMQTTIGQHASEIDSNTKNITSVTSKEAALEVTVNNISASLSSTQSTVSNQATQITTANNNISTLNTNVSNVTNRVSSLEITATGLTTRVGNTETAISSLSIGGRNLLRNFNSGLWTISSLATVNSNSKITLISSTNYGGDTLGITMSISPSTLYTFRCVANGWMSLREIDANGNQLTRTDSLGTSGLFNTGYIFKTTSTTAKLAIWYGSNSLGSGTYTFEKLKLEIGNKPTDYTPAPEDVDSSISAVKDYATQTINSNVSAINQTTDSIKASVQSLQSSVSTINTTLGNKADSSTVTSVTNRVSTLETGVNGINASITTLNSNVSSVTTTANAAKSAIDNLQVGGRNLIISSKTKMGYFIYNSGTATVNFVADSTTASGYRYDITITALDSNGYFNCYFGPSYSALFTRGNEKQYTISFKVKSTVSRTWPMRCEANNVSKNVSVTTSYQTVSMTGNSTLNYQALYIFNNTNVVKVGDVISFCDIKFEEGNQATSWTPAPEDTDSQITTINSSVSSLQSSISLLQNQIALKVEQSNIDSAVSTLNGKITAQNTTISSLQSQISLQAGQISSKVSQTDVNNSISDLISQISKKNYITNPLLLNDTTGWSAGGNQSIQRVTAITYANGINSLGIFATGAGSGSSGIVNTSVNVVSGNKYTISFYAISSTNGMVLHSELWGSNGAANFTLSNSAWTKCVATFTASTTGILYFWLNSSGDAYLTELRLEDGTTATTYGNAIGTIITQSPTEVMTAFNNISIYFQVSPEGAKFGDLSTGAYTKMSQKGLEHVDSYGAMPYHYYSYMGKAIIEMNGTTQKDMTFNFPQEVIDRLEGTIPYGLASVSFYSIGFDQSTGCIGCAITNITATTITLRAYLSSEKLVAISTPTNPGSEYETISTQIYAVTGSHTGSVCISYLIIG